jgi:hypothetical protein
MPHARHTLDGLARAGDTWPGQRDDGATRRRVASVCARLWGRSPLGRASLRLRESSHFDTSCMVGSMLLCA